MTPEPIEIVIRSSRCRKDMNQNVSVIHQNPLSGVVTFDADWPFPYFLQSRFHFVADCLTLPRIADRADYEEISKRGDRSQVENSDIRGLFGFSGLRSQLPGR